MLNTAKVSINFLALDEMKKILHPSYSPDLAPSDFSFPLSEKKSDGISCRELIRASGPHSRHFESHPSEILVEVFLEWMKRLQRCIDMNGE
jgi:hypothetical protein